MTSRLLLLLTLSTSLLAIQQSATAEAAAAAVTELNDDVAELWKALNSNDVPHAQPRIDSTASRQHKAFFVNYPVMQRVYKDNNVDLAMSESRKRRKQQRRKPNRKPESDIYYIKLPPAPYSYVEGLGYISQPPKFSPASLPKPKSKIKPKPKPFVNVPIDFVSNGKPTKVYHYPKEPIVRLNRGPYNFNGKPKGIYVMKKKPKRKPVLKNETSYKKKVVVKQR